MVYDYKVEFKVQLRVFGYGYGGGAFRGVRRYICGGRFVFGYVRCVWVFYV